MTTLEEKALALSDFFLPKVNYADSFLDAKAIEAVSLFELEVEKLRRMARIEITGMCRSYLAVFLRDSFFAMERAAC